MPGVFWLICRYFTKNGLYFREFTILKHNLAFILIC